MSFSKCSSQELVIVIHESCHTQGQLCLHIPSTEFAHAQLRLNMTQNHNFLGESSPVAKKMHNF